ncbi:uncharacterized protein FIBRA_08671 [Fibroporia radiculosa]|uniref:Uncharacterized protein n=1 Tax=Fibroporia radiculosa TaxID=599839 RepID=J4GX83_9APHY|nr:uncharacterized protein FIBRA_08671 [Fibroporia radiculosa]CCM06410.1 predicted protein [Fibroporia radiculosa]
MSRGGAIAEADVERHADREKRGEWGHLWEERVSRVHPSICPSVRHARRHLAASTDRDTRCWTLGAGLATMPRTTDGGCTHATAQAPDAPRDIAVAHSSHRDVRAVQIDLHGHRWGSPGIRAGPVWLRRAFGTAARCAHPSLLLAPEDTACPRSTRIPPIQILLERVAAGSTASTAGASASLLAARAAAERAVANLPCRSFRIDEISR